MKQASVTKIWVQWTPSGDPVLYTNAAKTYDVDEAWVHVEYLDGTWAHINKDFVFQVWDEKGD